MNSTKLRFGGVTIKFNIHHYELNESGGFNKFYKDFEHWCDAVFCESVYGPGSVLGCLEPNEPTLDRICNELAKTGSVRTIRKEQGEPQYILAPKVISEDYEETYGYFFELGGLSRSVAESEVGLETIRLTHLANPIYGQAEELAFMGFLKGVIESGDNLGIKRLIVDCDESLEEAIWNSLVALDAEVVEYKSDPESIQELMRAISKGNQEGIERELDRKRNLNQFNGYGNSPLFEAIHVGKLELAGLLIDQGAYLNIQNSRGFSAVLYAARLGNLDCVQKLVEMGADLNLKSVRNENCLMFAAANGNREMVRFLLKQGMNPNLKSKFGKTAAQFAADFGHIALADELEKAE